MKKEFRIELEQLEKKVVEERNRLQESKPGSENSTAELFPQVTMNDRFLLHKELGCFILLIELSMPIDYVLLQVSWKSIPTMNDGTKPEF